MDLLEKLINYFYYLIKKGKKFQLDCVDNNISSNKQKNLLKKNINFII